MIDRIDTKVFDAKKLKLLEGIGYLIEWHAIRRCPVLTGNMRSKITHAVEEDAVRIGTVGVPYAAYVEYGTVTMIAAHGPHDPNNPVTDWEALRKRGAVGQTMPFLAPAVFTAQPKIDELMRATFR